jgi:hypothetical protein
MLTSSAMRRMRRPSGKRLFDLSLIEDRRDFFEHKGTNSVHQPVLADFVKLL